MKKLKKEQIRDRIYLLDFDTQYELAASFLRFQEHYESRKFHGKVFSLEEFMDWYAKTFGNFTYYQDWSGFNVPSSVLLPFYEGKFDPLLNKEKRLLDLFRDQQDDFYIVGVCDLGKRKRLATLKHEIAHGLFYTQPGYRKKVLAALRRYDTQSLQKKLYKRGYCRAVLKDEVHAYVLCGEKLVDEKEAARLAPLRTELRKLYRTYSARAKV